MQRKKHEISAAILAAVFLLLCGCGSTETDVNTTAEEVLNLRDETESEDLIRETADGDYYVCAYAPTDTSAGALNFLCAAENGWYGIRDEERTNAAESDSREEPDTVTETCLYEIGYDGTMTCLSDFRQLTDPEGRAKYTVVDLCAADGRLFLLEEEYREWSDAGEGVVPYSAEWYAKFVRTEQYHVRELNKTGEELSDLILQDPTGTGFPYLHGLTVTEEGHFLAACDGWGICSFDSDGKVEYVIPTEEEILSLKSAGDGIAAAVLQGKDRQHMLLIDTKTRCVQQDLTLPDDAVDLTFGGGNFEYYYTSDDCFWGVNAAGESICLLRWPDCGVDSGFIDGCYVREDGAIFCVADTWTEGFRQRSSGCVLLRRSEGETEITDVRLGTIKIDRALRNKVVGTNCEQIGMRVVAEDYSVYGDLAETRLYSDLMDENGPDLLDLNGLDVEQLTEKGLLTDLVPYLNAEGLNLVDGIPENIGQNGAIYQPVNGFRLTIELAAMPISENEISQETEEILFENAEAAETAADSAEAETEPTEEPVSAEIKETEQTAGTEAETQLADISENPESEAIETQQPSITETEIQTEIPENAIRFNVRAETMEDLLRIISLADGRTEFCGYVFQLSDTAPAMELNTEEFALCRVSGEKAAAWNFLRPLFCTESDMLPATRNEFAQQLKELNEKVLLPEGGEEASDIWPENALYQLEVGDATVYVKQLSDEQIELLYELISRSVPAETAEEKAEPEISETPLPESEPVPEKTELEEAKQLLQESFAAALAAPARPLTRTEAAF